MPNLFGALFISDATDRRLGVRSRTSFVSSSVNDSVRRRASDERQRDCVSRLDPPVSVVLEGQLGPSWLLDRAVQRSHRKWALSSGAETGAVEVAGWRV
jgi:hypothetical protein